MKLEPPGLNERTAFAWALACVAVALLVALLVARYTYDPYAECGRINLQGVDP